MTGKKIAWLLPLMALLMGCGGQPTAKKLVEIDSLLWSEETDSAYQMIADYDPASFKNEADHAYYNLLMTHAACVSLHFPSSDSLINEAIRYYKHTGEKERLVDSYYYKASIFMNQQDWNKSIEILKLAEEKVEQTESNWLKYKVYDAIALVNERTASYQLALDYEKKALHYVLRVGRRSSIAYVYFEIATAFAFMEQMDSAVYYTDKLIPYLYDLKKSCGANFNPEFLSSIGYNYMSVGRYEEAKKYLEQSLMVKETAVAYSYLAWIYQKEGDEEQAHLLYLKAQAINDDWPKHKVLYNLLQYDIAHQNLEDAEKKLESLMAISDSLRQAEKSQAAVVDSWYSHYRPSIRHCSPDNVHPLPQDYGKTDTHRTADDHQQLCKRDSPSETSANGYGCSDGTDRGTEQQNPRTGGKGVAASGERKVALRRYQA